MLSMGIVGLPNVGKSTLFNALTKKRVPAENYPFCTIDPSVGVVAVPDPRLAKLTELSRSAKIVPAAIEFVDIAGLVKGASEGEGLGNQFLANIRETDAIVEIVRIFEDANVVHVNGRIDPLHDIEVINLELMLADVQTVEKRLSGVTRDAKRGDKTALAEEELLKRAHAALKEGKPVGSLSFTEGEFAAIKGLSLLTMKPILYALNKKAGGENLDETDDERYAKLIAYLKESGAQYVTIDAGIEQELSSLEGEEREAFRGALNGTESDGVDDLIRASYDLLGLITFFTTGEDETRAWTVKRGSTAPVAGGAIHSDFTEKFIRAEVIAYDNLVAEGSYAAAREKGLLRTEGKEYVVKDGDVIEFKI